MPTAQEKAWSVTLPVELRRSFTGLCRMRGERVKDVLVRILSRWVFEERQNQTKEAQ